MSYFRCSRSVAVVEELDVLLLSLVELAADVAAAADVVVALDDPIVSTEDAAVD